LQKKYTFSNLEVTNHPLIKHKLSIMRSKETNVATFRSLLNEISFLMGYEVTRSLMTESYPLETPVAHTIGKRIIEEDIVIVPILRAGLGMIDGLTHLIPGCRIGHIGVYRDEATKRPVEYLVKLPPLKGKTIIVVDPMLATGNSASYTFDILKQNGGDENKMIFMSLVSAPEGIELFNKKHSKIKIYTASLDEKLDEKAYIIPGLGDAGDRIFGT